MGLRPLMVNKAVLGIFAYRVDKLVPLQREPWQHRQVRPIDQGDMLFLPSVYLLQTYPYSVKHLFCQFCCLNEIRAVRQFFFSTSYDIGFPTYVVLRINSAKEL